MSSGFKGFKNIQIRLDYPIERGKERKREREKRKREKRKREKERKREREKEKERKREREKERKREREKDRKTERQKDRKTERQKDRKTERQKNRGLRSERIKQGGRVIFSSKLVCLVIPSKVVPLFMPWVALGSCRFLFLKGTFRFPI